MARIVDKDGNFIGFERDDNNFGRNREDIPIHGPQPVPGDETRGEHSDNNTSIPNEQINID